MAYSLLNITIHIVCFAICFFALSAVKFDRFCNVKKPFQVQLLMIMLAMGLGYVCAQFLLALTIYNGL